jgi:kynurenine formamidase
MRSLIENEEILVDLDHPLDISIPLRHGPQNPNCYHAAVPEFIPVVQNGFTGSVAAGGPCNHNVISLAPHGNGTHTECLGHLSPDPEITLNRCLKKFHFLARLISVPSRPGPLKDQMIRWQDVKNLAGSRLAEALIIRTLPNSGEKLSRQYSGLNPPYLEPGFGEQLASHNVMHLLVDLPSLDKEYDHGALVNHHGFWNYPDNPRMDCTITELIFVPNEIPDGEYLLNLQICSIESDASPSKPVLYRLINH